MRQCLAILIIMLVGVPGIPGTAVAEPAAPPARVGQRYAVDVAFDPAAATITGTVVVTWTNLTGEPQSSLPFRLYPDAGYYGEGGIELHAVTVDGHDAGTEVSASDPTVMRVPFGSTVLPGGERTIAMGFVTTIPIDSRGSYGIFRGNSVDGSWSLVNWYPIVAGWEPDGGWYLDPPTGAGDPTFVTASAWQVTIRHPASFAVVATGDEQTRPGDAALVTTTVDLEIGREFAMTLLPADDLVTSTSEAAGTRVEVTLPREVAIPGMADRLARFATDALPRYAEWFGLSLPGELDLTAVDLDGALGVSWSGAIWFDLEQLAADGELDDAGIASLRFVVYHEIAHQWMANIIGTNSNDHTFLTEGLANVLAVAVVRDLSGADRAEYVFTGWVAGPYRAFVNGDQDAVADSPVGKLTPVVHSLVTYGKGGVGFEAIRERIGNGAFTTGLEHLGIRYAWKIVTPEAVLDAFESSSGRRLGEDWSFWFESTGAIVDDVDRVIRNVGAP